MGVMGSQFTSLMIVYSTVYSGTDKKKPSKFRATCLCAGNSPGTGKNPAQMASNAEMFPFDDVIMLQMYNNVVVVNDNFILKILELLMEYSNMYLFFPWHLCWLNCNRFCWIPVAKVKFFWPDNFQDEWDVYSTTVDLSRKTDGYPSRPRHSKGDMGLSH